MRQAAESTSGGGGLGALIAFAVFGYVAVKFVQSLEVEET
jgi:hypothetical protein